MTATHSRASAAPTPSSVPRLISLSYALDAPAGLLGRRARRLAAHLAHHPADRALQRRAANMLAEMLTSTDAGVAFDDDGLLDSGFDS